jgi:hypothetical protein
MGPASAVKTISIRYGRIANREYGGSNWTPTLTWEDSNFDIPISKKAFEMSAEFPLF